MAHVRAAGALCMSVLAALFACSSDEVPEPDAPQAAATPDAGSDSAPVDAAHGDASGDASMPGPLPRGLTLVARAPVDGAVSHAAMVLDGEGSPMFAWLEVPKDQPGSVKFSRWSTKRGAFRAPVTVAQLAAPDTSSPSHRSVALAYDPASQLVAVAYVQAKARTGRDPLRTVVVSFSSDSGVTFPTSEEASIAVDPDGADEHASDPSIAIRQGTTYVAYVQEQQRCGGVACAAASLATRAAQSGNWSRTVLPIVEGTTAQLVAPTSLAISASGTAGVLYFARNDAGDDLRLVFADALGEVATVAGSEGVSVDAPTASLAYVGDSPRAAFHLPDVDTADYDISYRGAEGLTWGNLQTLPRDGDRITSAYVALAMDAAGAPHVAAHVPDVAARGDCGGPLMYRNSVSGELDSACLDETRVSEPGGGWVSLAIAPDSAEIVGFVGTSTATGPGLVVWRSR